MGIHAWLIAVFGLVSCLAPQARAQGPKAQGEHSSDDKSLPASLAEADRLIEQTDGAAEAVRRCEQKKNQLQKQYASIKLVKSEVPSLKIYTATGAAEAPPLALRLCDGSFTAEGLLSSMEKDPQVRFWRPAGIYFACMAYARQNGQACARLKKLSAGQPQSDPAKDCWEYYLMTAWSHALIAGNPGINAACAGLKSEPISGGLQFVDMCPALSGYPGAPDLACKEGHVPKAPSSKSSRYKADAAGLRECGKLVSTLNGLSDCAAGGDWQFEFGCKNYAAFRKAYAGKDSSLCGSLPLCRVMMGGGEAVCRAYLEGEKTRLCKTDPADPTAAKLAEQLRKNKNDTVARYESMKKTYEKAPGVYPPERQALLVKINESGQQCEQLMKGFQAKLDKAMALVQGTEPKSLPGIDERRDKILGLQDDLKELHNEYLPPTKK